MKEIMFEDFEKSLKSSKRNFFKTLLISVSSLFVNLKSDNGFKFKFTITKDCLIPFTCGEEIKHEINVYGKYCQVVCHVFDSNGKFISGITSQIFLENEINYDEVCQNLKKSVLKSISILKRHNTISQVAYGKSFRAELFDRFKDVI